MAQLMEFNMTGVNRELQIANVDRLIEKMATKATLI